MKFHEVFYLSPFLQMALLVFSVIIACLGLFMDAMSLSAWKRTRDSIHPNRGLPLVPWLLYFTAGFFLFLRENPIAGGVLVLMLSAWHFVVRSKVRT